MLKLLMLEPMSWMIPQSGPGVYISLIYLKYVIFSMIRFSFILFYYGLGGPSTKIIMKMIGVIKIFLCVAKTNHLH